MSQFVKLPANQGPVHIFHMMAQGYVNVVKTVNLKHL